MDRKEYTKAIRDVIYLSYCAVSGRVPGRSRLEAMDLKAVHKASSDHMLTAACAMALESAGIEDEAFTQDRAKAQRKVAAMDIDKLRLFSQLETEGIWYMPLKGSVLKDLYPKFGMRQMSDFDILFDSTRADDVQRIMEGLGFTSENVGHGNHDVYHKPPVSNFEMHRALFGIAHEKQIYEYYKDVKDRLVRDSAFGYHFTPEDFYVYLMAHEYKHYSISGTGLRSVLDTYVYLTHYGDSLDLGYIAAECEKLGIDDFERKNRSLALDLFGGEKLTDEDRKMLRYIVFSGTYGNLDNNINNKLDKIGKGPFVKLRYAVSRITVPISRNDPRYAAATQYYPWFYENRLRLPLLFFYRIGRGLTVKRRKAAAEFKALLKNKRS